MKRYSDAFTMQLGPLGYGWICTSDSDNKQLMKPNHKPNQRSLEALGSVDKIPKGEAQRAYVNTSKASEALRSLSSTFRVWT